MTRGNGTATGGSAGLSGAAGASAGRASAAGSRDASAPAARQAGEGYLCTFEVNGQKFALSTSLVRELLEVSAVTPVPRTDSAILGLFNLRGEPMPLVDMAMLLGTGPSSPSAKTAVLILRSEGMSVGARIDALGTVVPNSGLVASDEPHPLLLGFLTPQGQHGSAIAVINPAELLARLGRLKRSTSERQ